MVKQRGRPRLPSGEKRAWVISMRIRPAEWQRIRQIAESEGKLVSEWMRHAALQAAESALNGSEINNSLKNEDAQKELVPRRVFPNHGHFIG
jgi:uncharacterized protein (DUF1778 family)